MMAPEMMSFRFTVFTGSFASESTFMRTHLFSP